MPFWDEAEETSIKVFISCESEALIQDKIPRWLDLEVTLRAAFESLRYCGIWLG